MWIPRFLNRFLDRTRVSEQTHRIEKIFAERGRYPNTSAFLQGILDELPASGPIENTTIARICHELQHHHSPDAPTQEQDLITLVSFWRTMVGRFENQPGLLGCYGDALLANGQVNVALEQFFAAAKIDPTFIYECGDEIGDLARRCGPDSVLRYRLAVLAAKLVDAYDSQAVADEAREMYSELLIEYHDDVGAIRKIRTVGAQIDQLVEQDRLPRSIVRRVNG